MLADQPRLISWKVLLAFVLDPLRRSVCGPHANCGETSFQPTLGPVSPTHILPFGVGQRVFGRARQDIRNVPLARAPPIGNRPDQLYPDRIHLKVTRDTNSPSNATCREPLTERRPEAVTRIRQYTAEANPGSDHPIDLSQRDLWLGPCCAMLDWNTSTLQTRRIARPALGKEETQCHHYRHFTPRKRQRYQRLAIGCLAERRGVLRSDANRTIALLRQRGVVDDKHRILAAYEPDGLMAFRSSAGSRRSQR